jgi:hypothetical protein
MPDDPRPLSPAEIEALERGELIHVSDEQWLATVRDRGRQRDEAARGWVKMQAERDELQRQLISESEQHANTKRDRDLWKLAAQEHQRQLAEDQAEHNKLLEYARRVAGTRDVHSVYEVLDKLAEARADTERLDWLQQKVIWQAHAAPDLACFKWDVDVRRNLRGKPIREVLDVAREKEATNKTPYGA